MRCGADFILSICLLFNCKAYLNSVIVWRGSMAARSIVLTGRSQHIALFVAFLLVVCVFLRYKDLLWEALRHRYDKATSLNPRKWVNGVLCSWRHQAWLILEVWYDLVLVLDFEVTPSWKWNIAPDRVSARCCHVSISTVHHEIQWFILWSLTLYLLVITANFLMVDAWLILII